MKLPLGDPSTLTGRATRALGWSFFSTALARFGTMGIGIFLARLLGPHAFGTFAVAFVAMSALLSVNGLGVGLAIVRWPGEPHEIAPTVATVSTISGVLLYIGCFFGAPAFSAAMGAPAATPVIRVLALNVVISGVVAVPAELLQRYFRQDRKMIADQTNNWVGAGVSITLAWFGFGAMSLGIGQLAGGLAAGVVYLVVSPIRLRFGFDLAKARALLRFGLPLTGSSAIVFAVSNVDNLIVGHMLGPTVLGYYVLAWNLANWPIAMFSQPVRGVAPPLFSRLQHDPPAMRNGFLSVMGMLGSVTFPICLLITGAAVPLLHFVYGARWAPAAQALVWLGVLAALRILFELIYDYFVVLARSSVVLTVELLWLFALIPALIVGSHFAGLSGAGAADVAVAAFVVLPWYLRELNRAGIRRRAVAARLWLPVTAATGVAVAAAAAAKLIPIDLVALAVSGLIALLVVGLLTYRSRALLASLRTGAGDKEPAADTASAATLTLPVFRDTVRHSPNAHDTNEALRLLISLATPQTAALPVSPHNGAVPVSPQTGLLPVYQETVAALRWDPVQVGRRRGAHRVTRPSIRPGESGRQESSRDGYPYPRNGNPPSRHERARPERVQTGEPRENETASSSTRRPRY
jgi:O-antigen/teichoic acid export membrane protein